MLADSATGHEANRLRVRGLVGFAAALVGVTVLVEIMLAFVMQGFSREEKQLESLALPRFVGDTGEYPAPRIQADPATELTKMKAEDLGQLNNYGWVDRKAGLAHIPVDRAIGILAQKGLPTPEERGVTPEEPAKKQGAGERKDGAQPGARGEPKQ
jgi:hypothetical protein